MTKMRHDIANLKSKIAQAGAPRNEPELLLILQDTLLSIVESYLGPRDSDFKLEPPIFEEAGPRILHYWPLGVPEKRVGVTLSLNAAGYWPTTIFEMAHEVVHLLNPVTGNTNHLEEGLATYFQEKMVFSISGRVMTAGSSIYSDCCTLVHVLGSDPLEAGRKIRERCGALSRATAEDLHSLFPQVSQANRTKLAETCIPR